jgi:hypothetical protein
LSLRDYEKKEKQRFKCPKCHSKNVEQLVLGCTIQTKKKS